MVPTMPASVEAAVVTEPQGTDPDANLRVGSRGLRYEQHQQQRRLVLLEAGLEVHAVDPQIDDLQILEAPA